MAKQILVVDDNPENLMLIQMILKRFFSDEFKILEANDGAAGLRMAFENQPDLILMDLRMPHMDGFEAIQELRNNPATQDIAIIILTGLSDDEEVTRAIKVGANGYLIKPININTFVQTIQPFLNPDASSR